jgi:hydroxyacylglutathione hydrolase
MILESFPVGPLQANCTILGDPEAGEAIVIDPGDEAERIHGRLTKLGLKLKQILLTHAPHRPRGRRSQAQAVDRRAHLFE